MATEERFQKAAAAASLSRSHCRMTAAGSPSRSRETLPSSASMPPGSVLVGTATASQPSSTSSSE